MIALLLAVGLAAEPDEPWVVLKPQAVATMGPATVTLKGGSGWSAQRLPLPGPDVWVHTEPGPIEANPHCNPIIETPGMRLGAKVGVQDTVEVVTEAVSVRQSAESLLEVLPGSAVARAELDGRARFWAGDVRVILAREIETGPEYRPGKRSWDVGDSLRGSGPIVGDDEVWEVEGGELATEIQPLLVEMRTTCVHAIGLAADPVTDRATWNAHLNVPVEPVEAEVWVVPDGSLLSWPDGTGAGEVVGEAMFPAATSVSRIDRRCGVFGIDHYVDPDPDEAVEVCFSESSATVETRSSTLFVSRDHNDRSTALIKKAPMRHPGREFGKKGQTVTCNVSGTVGKSGKIGKLVITGCGEVFQNATKVGLAKWRWNRPIVNGERVEFQETLSVDFPHPDGS